MNTPPVTEEDGVTGPEVRLGHALPSQRAANILHGDFVALRERPHPFVSGHVHQDAARDDRLDVLDAELSQAVGAPHFLHGDAVVEHVPLGAIRHRQAGTDMAEPVELRTDLPDLRAHELVMSDQPVRAERLVVGG